MAVVLAAGTLALSSCSSGDTIVSVNYSFDDATAADVKMNAAKLHIEISTGSGSPVQTDIDIMRDPDAGTITTASYKRVKVDGLSGKATVTATALDSGGAELMKVTNAADAPVTIVEHEVTAAFVKFAKVVAPMPDAGMEMDAAGSGGSSGSGGSTGSGGSDGSGGSSGSGGSGSGGSGSGGSG